MCISCGQRTPGIHREHIRYAAAGQEDQDHRHQHNLHAAHRPTPGIDTTVLLQGAHILHHFLASARMNYTILSTASTLDDMDDA
jgi:hypothetical protein